MEIVHRSWEETPLALAADWLHERFGDDLQGVLVALPGARAGRILSERLARLVGPALRPPKIVTAGVLSDDLLEVDGVPAGRLVRTAAWEKALRELDEDAQRRIVARPPAEGDRRGWNRLAEEVRGLFGEIAAEGLDFAAVASSPEGSPFAGERARWAALARAQAAMQEILAGAGRVDPHLGRLRAIEEGRAKDVRAVVLVGVSEMNELLRRALALCAAPQTALVFAPEELADAFDELGCLVPEKWIERGTTLALEDWHVVSGPDEQALRAVEVIGGWKGAWAAEEITVGLADSEVAPFLKGRFAERGGLARDAAGTPFSRTAPALLLEAVGAFLDGRRFADFAALVRHPDFEAALRDRGSELDPAGIVDEYHNAHLPSKADGEWLGGGTRERGLRERMEALWRGSLELLGELASDVERSPTAWIARMRDFLERVYAGRELDPRRERDRVLQVSLQLVGEGLAEVEALPPDLAPRGPATESIDAVLRDRRAETVPPAPLREGEAAIELLGWLELALDDAPALVVTGFEDGRVPESVRGDAYLPNRLREHLSLVDDSRRLARDLYATEWIVHSRERAVFITGRRNLAGEPQVPSRIVFHCEPEALLPRVKRFLDGGTASPRPIATGTDVTRDLPRKPFWKPPAAMRVTDFKLYLQSPYEYYLRRILELESPDHDAREIEAMAFGNLAHAALQRFGQDPRARDSREPEPIAAFLDGELRSLAAEMFGKHPLPAVRLQIEQLAFRFACFAEHQARRRSEGWEIREVEWSPDGGHCELPVDGEAVRLRGRIDRIDRHPEHGWAILDYKTGEKVERPENAHRTRGGEWTDLQLPLYCLLVHERIDSEKPPHLGYAALGCEPGEIGFKTVPEGWRKSDPFDDVAAGVGDAIERARDVVREIRAGKFFDLAGFAPHEPILKAIGGVGLVGVESSEGEAAP